MRAIAYMRRSQDTGTGVSEEIQDDAIREYVERKGGEVKYWLPVDQDASSWTLNRPSMQKALALLADGKADTLVVAKLSRVTRRRKDWEALLALMQEQGWTIKSADFDVDLSDKGGRLIAGILIDFLGYEYEEKRDSYDAARRNAVLTHGIHGGSVPPLGYEWSVRGHDRAGNAQRGPLVPTADAPNVTAGFKARAEGAQWLQVIDILGVKGLGAAQSVIANRTYLGEARSGDFVKPGAHPALVDEDVFRRANRLRKKRSVGYKGREGRLLGGGIARCASCGYALSYDGAARGDHYRCKQMKCTAKASVAAALIEPYLLTQALTWHASMNPMHIGDLDEAAVVVFEDELDRARAEMAEVEAEFEAGNLSPVAYGRALTAAQLAVAAAEASLADAEASQGWLGMTVEAVQRRLFGGLLATKAETVPGTVIAGFELPPVELVKAKKGYQAMPPCKDVAAGREFIGQMLRATVKPVGRGRKVPLDERVEIELLSPAAALQEEAFVQMEAVRRS